MNVQESPFEFIRLYGIEIVKISSHILNFEKHTHTTDFTCSVITDGEALLNVAGKEVSVYQNSCFTVLPNCPHCLTSEKPVSMISLCISSEFIKNYQAEHEEYRKIIIRNLEIADISQKTAELLCDAADDIFGLYKYADITDDNPSYAEKNPYYSKYHYIRKFNSKLGLTPHKYQLQCRIRETQSLLINGYTSADAAAEKEFYDQSHFIKCFIKHYKNY